MPTPDENESVDKQTNVYLQERRGRKLEEAKQAELARVAEEEKTEAARLRKERELIEAGKVSPINEEVTMEDTEKRVDAAAEVAAEAASAGVDPDKAKDLGTGKSKVVVITPGSGEATPPAGGWSVIDGKPVKDPEGEYTFSQAHKVASLEAAKSSDDPLALFKFLKDEGFLGGKSDDFMTTFMTELAKKSVDNLVHPPTGNSSGGSSDAALREEIGRLREEVRRSSDPVEAAKRVKEMVDAFKGTGLIPESTTGTTLEVTKETHRHDEKMEELKTEKDYKEKLGETVADLPERIGRGIGGQIMEEEESKGGGGGGRLETIDCECGAKLRITPGADSVTCGKCGNIYGRTGTAVETKEE